MLEFTDSQGNIIFQGLKLDGHIGNSTKNAQISDITGDIQCQYNDDIRIKFAISNMVSSVRDYDDI